jgi:hypothetical protein
METMNTRRALLAALMLLATVLACAVPGLPTASQTAPTADTRLERMVAETVSAALAETQQALPMPTTAEVISTPTFEPTPVPTASLVPDVDDSGSSINRFEDNSSKFTDMRAGYEISLLEGWLPIRINSQEYLDAWLLPELSNPAMQRSLSSIEKLNPDELRLFVLDVQEGHAEIDFITNINFYWNQLSDMSLETDEDLKAEAAALPSVLSGLEVTSTEISTTAREIPVGVITSKAPITTVSGVNVELFQKQVFIKTNVGVLVVTLSTTEELKQTVLPQFDAMIETFILLSE